MSARPPTPPAAQPPTLRSLADDLRARSDAELADLLRARPDLARPAPADVTALAARATTRASIQRALDGLDLAHLQALEAVVVAAPTGADQVAGLLGTTPQRAASLLDRLHQLALCWRAPEGLRPARPVADVIGDPAGLGPALPGVPEGEALTAALADLDARARQVLDALAWGPPVGALRLRTGADGPGSVAQAGQQLVEAGLLARVDGSHVALPRQVALALRGGRLHRHPASEPPAVEASALDPEVVDAAAGGRAADLITLATEVIDRWGTRPPRVLRAGGLAVRDLGRLATHLEIDTDECAWLLETMLAAGLVAAGEDESGAGDDSLWLPTTRADEWLADAEGERWAWLAQAWWAMPAAPSLVGPAEGGGRVNALSTQTSSPLGRVRRHDALAAVATLAAGAAPSVEGLSALLRWRHPLRSARGSGDPGAAAQVALREAEWAGVTARGALSGPGRLLVDGPPTGEGQALAAAAMQPLVPPAVEHVLLQADLTAIAPGRLDGAARTLIHLLSDVESRGGATVHRFGEESVRRALDAGWTADRILTELAAISSTGVPQPLDYLVRDVARRHGQARVGACSAYLRSDDVALLDRVEHDRALGLLQWRRLAPTVLVSPVPAATVLDVLREQQYGPVVEGGGLALAAPAVHRAVSRSAPPVQVSTVDDQVARAVVALLRRGEGARSAGLDDPGTHTDPVVITAVLREAVVTGDAVWIGYADEVGGIATHLVRPLAVEGGRLRAGVGEGDVVRSFLLHRLTGVRAAD